MWQEQKKMAQHLLANYQPEEARRERGEGKTDQHTHTHTKTREQKDEANKKERM